MTDKIQTIIRPGESISVGEFRQFFATRYPTASASACAGSIGGGVTNGYITVSQDRSTLNCK